MTAGSLLRQKCNLLVVDVVGGMVLIPIVLREGERGIGLVLWEFIEFYMF